MQYNVRYRKQIYPAPRSWHKMEKATTTKRLIVTALILLMSRTPTYCQNLQVSVQAGQYWSISNNVFYEGNRRDVGGMDIVIGERYSFGAGQNYQLGVEYELIKGVGIGLRFGRLHSKGVNLRIDDSIGNMADMEFEASSNRIVPSIFFTREVNRIILEASIGCSIGFGTKIERSFGGLMNRINYTTWKYHGGNMIGVNYSIGVGTMVNEKLHVCLLIEGFSESFGPRKGTKTHHVEEGKNKVNELSVNARKVDFVDEDNVFEVRMSSEPQKLRRIFYPFSSVGMAVKIGYKLM